MLQNAKWITSPAPFGDGALTFQKQFTAEKKIKKATLFASAMGIYVPCLNGEKIGDNVLAPGITSYKNRVQYQAYDVTQKIQKENCLSIGLGRGWAMGHYGWTTEVYAEDTALIARVEIEYTDGEIEEITTGTDWEVFTSQVTFSEIYHGETVDKTAPVEKIGLAAKANMDAALVPQSGEWIMEQERLLVKEVIRTPKGEMVLDFGQNMTGYVEVTVQGNKGDTIVMHHGEVLDKDGNFYNENYRSARNEITYVLSGEADVFKPRYSFQGFRYVKLVSYPFEEVKPEQFTAIVVHSELMRTGNFRCGNEKINQLYHNIIWGQKGNFLDIPTDCPQRDERLGWTGDAQVFCRTAAIHYDVEKFFAKWLEDVAIEQEENGAVRGIVPDCLGKAKTNISAAYGDAACIIPWELYLAYGNKELLKKHFPMMKKWVDYIHSAGSAEFLWLNGVHYGDWLAMDAGEDSYIGATAADLIASAFFAYSTELVVRAGEAIGENVTAYRALHQNIVKTFRVYFMENGMPKEEIPYTGPVPEGKSTSDFISRGITQTALSLILHFRLCQEEERPTLSAKLVELIEKNNGLLATGFVGTPYILHALSENGYTKLAYDLLLEERSPSWLYSVCHGATTIWEHWNGIKEDGSFWSADMNSFNHYSYGSVFDWIFGVSCGVQPTAPGYRKILLAPKPDKRLGFAESSIQTRCGKICSGWRFDGDKVTYAFSIPDGVTANLILPSGTHKTLTGGTYSFTE